MASSSTLCSATEAETLGVVLPIDLIYEILIRLPAEELCRLRVVCQPWRSLLSDPKFIAAHSTRHRRPLLVAWSGSGRSYPDDDGILCRIIDLSGRVIKQICSKTDECLISTQCNLACVGIGGNPKQCRLLNLVTGERFELPKELSLEHMPRKLEFWTHKVSVSVAFGHVASTGEFKLLRVIKSFTEQLCEVFTHGGSRGFRWRGKKATQDRVDMSPMSRVVIDGVVYFLLVDYLRSRDVRPKGIASFDLLTEEWKPFLRGPVSILAESTHAKASLDALDGSLVLVHYRRHAVCFSMDLWFLMDFEKGLWVKQHAVKNLSLQDGILAHPLVILKNGSIVICIGSRRVLMIYDPRTNTCTDVAKMVSRVPRDGSGLYTGNLLSMANDAI